MDYSIVFDLIWKIINMILRKNGVFESAAELGVDLSKYILSTDDTTTTTTAATQTTASTSTSTAGSIVGGILSGLL